MLLLYHPSMMENLLFSDEIITDILSRLPVESILNCKLVCKTWQTLTYNPSFALMHLCRRCSLVVSTTTTHHHLLLDVDDDDDDKYKSSSSMVGFVFLIPLGSYGGPSKLYYGEYDYDDNNVHHVEEEAEEESTYKRLRMINHPAFAQSTTFVGSCNGLICFTVSHHHIDDPTYICNPITREYIYLPRFTKKRFIKKGGAMASGFGYHSKTNEYKVVRIYFERDDDVGQVQAYTLGSGSSGWRNKGEIKFNSGVRIAVLANGALHWGDKLGKIVSFDLANEEFYFLTSPPGPPFCCDCYFSLPKVLRGLLCVATQEEGESVKVWSLKKTNSSSSSSSSCNMLKKQECHKSWSWSLEFSIKWEGNSITKDLFNVYVPFALIKSGEVLLLWYYSRLLCGYNLKTSSLEKLGTYAPVTGLGLCGYCQIIPHMNSFISFKDFGEEDVKVIGSDEGAIIDQAPSGNLFYDYFRRADLNQDGLISAVEEAIFFQGFDLPPRVLGQIFRAVDPNRNLELEEEEFYYALKLVSVVQSGKQLTPDVVHETLHGADSDKIPAPKIINPAAAAIAFDTWPKRCYKLLCGNCRACRPDKYNL